MSDAVSRWMTELDAWLDERFRSRPEQDRVEEQLYRRMRPRNENANGSVFGGDILALMDEAGLLAAEQYADREAVTASISSMSFEAPVDTDALLVADASVESVGETSMTVGVDVEAEDLSTGERTETASAYITYVAKDAYGNSRQVPDLEEYDDRYWNAAGAKADAIDYREEDVPEPDEWDVETPVGMRGRETTADGRVLGGEILREMDLVASVAAQRYAEGTVVTASLDTMEFEEPVYEEDTATFRASIDHVGSSSMTIAVDVQAYGRGEDEPRHTGSAYLTFVALDEDGRPREVPGMQYDTIADQDRAFAAKEVKDRTQRS